MLNSDKERAILRVRLPAILTAYANVPTRWITNVSPQMTMRFVSTGYRDYLPEAAANRRISALMVSVAAAVARSAPALTKTTAPRSRDG